MNAAPTPRAAARPLKTVFVDNFFYSRTDSSLSVHVVPHLGLMALASLLHRAGHAAEILDPKILFARGGWSRPSDSFLDAWADDLLAREADVVGFTAYGRTLPFAVRVAQRLKRERPEQRVALGGPHATIVGARILELFDCFDVVARYEAEPIIVPLVETLAGGGDLSAIPGLIARRDGGLHVTPPLGTLPDMEQVPPAALELYPIDELALPELSIEAGRGCPFACTFCSTAQFFKRRYRLKSAERMLAEMEAARRRYGVRVFDLNHDLFGLVKKSLVEFCELVRGRGFEWKCSMRADTLDPSLVSLLAESGCRHLYFGIETGSPRLQRVVKKRLDLDDTRAMVAKVVAAGIECTVSFVTGFPEEREDDQDASLDLLGELLALDPRRVRPQLHVLSPEPGSELAETVTPMSFDGIGPESDELLDEELIRAHPDVFSVFYHYASATPRWRTLLASAFVTHLLPELGYALATHLHARFFDGRLSRLFRAVVPEQPAGPLDYETILALLRGGVDRVARGLGEASRYAAELVRFSRTAVELERLRSRQGARTNATLDAVLGVARFECDVPGLVAAILEQPTHPAPPALTAPAERWYLLGHDSAGQAFVGALAPEAGRELHAPHAAAVGGPGAHRLYEELGVRLIASDASEPAATKSGTNPSRRAGGTTEGRKRWRRRGDVTAGPPPPAQRVVTTKTAVKPEL